MGYSIRSGCINTFWPDDTDTELWIAFGEELSSIIDRCKAKWGDDISLEQLYIVPVFIQTDCLGYDRYDSGDYTAFLHITHAERVA